MEYLDLIQCSVDYIEANLQTELTAAELAQQAGFSLYHFCRLFQSATGLPLKRYILRRRLCHAAYAMHCGSLGVDAALRYGFDTYAGFYRAFLRELGCTPYAFLRAGRAKLPYCPDLRKEKHMLVTKQKAASLLQHWGMETLPLAEVYYDGTGRRNEHVYAAGSDYLLKFTTDLAGLRTNIVLSRAIVDAGLCAEIPVETVDGRDVVQEDALCFCLTQRMPGHQLLAADCYGDTSLCRGVGESIGLLHRALAQMDMPVDETELYQTVATWALPQTQAILGIDQAFCTMFLENFGRLYPELPRQIIHRDPNPGNMLRTEAGWGFLDFELSERNVRLYDPCYAATAILSESFGEQSQERWFDIYHAILEGYDRTAQLTDVEREAAPYVLLANQMICVAYFSQFEKHAEIFETNKRMTRWLLERWENLKL